MSFSSAALIAAMFSLMMLEIANNVEAVLPTDRLARRRTADRQQEQQEKGSEPVCQAKGCNDVCKKGFSLYRRAQEEDLHIPNVETTDKQRNPDRKSNLLALT